jgi:hypothetical protein
VLRGDPERAMSEADRERIEELLRCVLARPEARSESRIEVRHGP